MNILIIGEFSGFAMHLKNGFRQLGHQVTIVMGQDSFKKFKGEKDDILYGRNLILFGRSIKGSARVIKPFCALNIRWKLRRKYQKKRVDLIVVINSDFISTSLFQLGTPLSFVKKQLAQGARMILTECGRTPAEQYNHQQFWKERGKTIRILDNVYSFLLDNSHVIVPTIFRYYDNLISYSHFYSFDTNKIKQVIPLPITISKGCQISSCVGRKIVVFHGIIRPLFKGSSFIEAAMKRLSEEMPDKVECVCTGGMPYDEYIKLFDRMDILIDQTYANGWGMNALIGAMNGKCVLTSCGNENCEIMKIPHIPFVKIGPDSEQIYHTLKDLVLNPKRLDDIKQLSRRFAEEHCEASSIARRYLLVAGF